MLDCFFGETDSAVFDAVRDDAVFVPAQGGAFLAEGGVSIGGLRTFYGRQGQAIPTGLVMREARGGTPPYTYAMSDLPGGVTFTAATRVLSGTPSADGDFTPTYSVTDSSDTPVTVSKEFNWSVLDVLSTDAIMLQDFDDGKVGYGLSDFNFAFAGTYISGTNLGFTNAQVWAGYNRTAVGTLVDDPFEKLLLPSGGVMSRIDYRAGDNPDRFRLFDSNEDLNGNAVDSDIGAWASADAQNGLNLYLQRAIGTVGVTLSFEDDLQSTANWNATFELTAAQSTWIRANLSEDDQFLLVIA